MSCGAEEVPSHQPAVMRRILDKESWFLIASLPLSPACGDPMNPDLSFTRSGVNSSELLKR